MPAKLDREDANVQVVARFGAIILTTIEQLEGDPSTAHAQTFLGEMLKVSRNQLAAFLHGKYHMLTSELAEPSDADDLNDIPF